MYAVSPCLLRFASFWNSPRGFAFTYHALRQAADLQVQSARILFAPLRVVVVVHSVFCSVNSLCCCAHASDVLCHPWRWSPSRAVQLIRRIRTAILGQFKSGCQLVAPFSQELGRFFRTVTVCSRVCVCVCFLGAVVGLDTFRLLDNIVKCTNQGANRHMRPLNVCVRFGLWRDPSSSVVHPLTRV